MFSATPDAGVAVHADGGVLVHAGAVVAHVAVDLDLDLARRCPRRWCARPRGLSTRQRRGPSRADGVQARVQLAQRRRRRGRHVSTPCVASRHIRRAPAPSCTTRAGSGSQMRGALGAGQHRDGAVLGRHRDPVVGLGHDRRLAGDRVAQHGEAVARADRERVEAVQVVEAALERLLEGRALAQAPGEVAGRDLGVVVGLELDALARAARGAGGCGSRASRCARGRGRGRSRTGASARS